jgi:hypothetical protein
MRSLIVCALTLFAANAYVDRPTCCDAPAPQVIVVESRWTCERHPYPSYLGNRRDCYPERELYPGYVGNIDPRVRRVDVRELPCETSLHASYLGNQPAWNDECRRLKGLLAKTE